jgi:kynurenine formamidase
MCHVCVMENVKAKVSRRSLFKGAAIAAASGLTANVGLTSALAADKPKSFSRVVDLTHTLTKDFPTFFGTPAFEEEFQFKYDKDKLNLKVLKYAEHIGTHFDSPFHFSADGASIDQVPIEKLVCPLAVIDVKAKAAASADYQLTPDDIKAFEAKNGPIPEGACVAMNSGWQAHLGTPKFRGQDGDKKLHFPGFHPEATDFLMRERAVNGIAVDALSLDFGASADFKVHYSWLPSGRYGIENIANLDQVPPVGATLVGGAPKFEKATGGPGRVIALV